MIGQFVVLPNKTAIIVDGNNALTNHDQDDIMVMSRALEFHCDAVFSSSVCELLIHLLNYMLNLINLMIEYDYLSD